MTPTALNRLADTARLRRLKWGLVVGGVGSFTLNIAADVSAAYAQNAPAIPTKNPIVPRSSQ